MNDDHRRPVPGGGPAGDPTGGDPTGGPRMGAPDRSTLTPHDRRRLRATWRTAGAGVLAGILAAAVVAALGGSGAAGLAMLLAFAAAGCVLAAMVTALLAMVDEYRRVAVGRPRTLTALGLFLLGGLLLLMSGGAASG